MIRALIILLLVINYYKSSTQTYSSIVSDEEILNFMNWMVANDIRHPEEPKITKLIHPKIIQWKLDNFIPSDSARIADFPTINVDGMYIFRHVGGIDTIYKQIDKEFILSQYYALKDSIWSDAHFSSKFYQPQNHIRRSYYYFSVPLFSHDKNFVVITRNFYCGNLCGHGGHYIYMKIDENNWIFLTSLNNWIT